MQLILIFSLVPYVQNIINPAHNQYIFSPKSYLKPHMHFIPWHISLWIGHVSSTQEPHMVAS